VLEPMFSEKNRIYAYAIGILIGTAVQLAIPAWDLRNTPFKFSWSFEWRHPGVRRGLLLMLPGTISLGSINFNLPSTSFFGSLVSDEAPAAIDKAFRIYQLPQGIFSVAIATVLFPTLASFANKGEMVNLPATLANGLRHILFVLVPAAAVILALSDPIIRLVYQRGEFGPEETILVRTALFWFAFSLPTNGVYLLQTRTFFSLQKPWQATALAVIDLAVSAVAALALYGPFGVGGIVAGTGIGTSAAVFAQAFILWRKFGGLELGRLLSTTVRISIASLVLAAVAWVAWDLLDGALGRSTVAQIVSLGTAMVLGGVAYVGAAWLLRIAELGQILRLVGRGGGWRLGPGRYLLGVVELLWLVGFASVGASRVRRRLLPEI